MCEPTILIEGNGLPMNIFGMLAKVTPILLLIATGGFLRQRRFLSQDTVTDLKKLVLQITLPCLLYLSFADMALEGRYLVVMLTVFSACVLMLAAGIAARRLLRQQNPYYAALFTGFEAGMVAYPLFIPVFGAEHTSTVAIVQLGQTLFCFFVLFAFMQRQAGQTMPLGRRLVWLVKTPVIFSVLLGILAGVTGLGTVLAGTLVGATLLEWLRLLSSLTVPLIVLVIGYELHFDLREPERLKMPLITVLLRLGLMTLLAILINHFVIDRLLQLDRIFQMAVYTIFLLPPPFIIPILMDQATPEDRQFAVTTISLHIVVTLITFTLFILMI